MTWYLQLDPGQPPLNTGNDPRGYPIYSFNILVKVVHTEELEEELVKILEDAGVGTYGTDIFATTNARLPQPEDTTTPILLLIADGGRAPQRIQNQKRPKYLTVSVSVTVCCSSSPAARAMAFAAYNAFTDVRNETITV